MPARVVGRAWVRRQSVATKKASIVSLEILDVGKRYGGVTAIDRVTMRINSNTLHAIIGPNGAGKTTLFNILAGQTRPSSGRVMMDGKRIDGTRPNRLVQLGIARSFQITSVFPGLTVEENVVLSALGHVPRSAFNFLRMRKIGGSDRSRINLSLEAAGLYDSRASIASELSHGEQRLLEVAMSLVLDPSVLLLDEPAAGMGTYESQQMEDLIMRLKGSRTIVLVEHNIDLIMRIADSVTVMANGSVLAEGDPEAISRDPKVLSAYIGG